MFAHAFLLVWRNALRNKSLFIINLAGLSIALLVYLWVSDEVNTFAFRIKLQWWYFGLSCAIIFLIAWITISSQAFKAARSNPVDALRSE